MRRGNRSFAFILLLTALPLAAESPRELTVDWIYGDEAAAATKLPKFAWTNGGDVLLLDERAPAASRTIERVRADSGRRSPALDAKAALSSLAALSPKGAPEALAWPDSLDSAGTTAVYVFGDDLYALNLASSRFARLSTTAAKESLPRLSPDGRKLAFVRDNDLFVYDLAAKTETRLTTDGSDTVLNGTLSWLYWEEIFDRGDTGYWWSPDSSAIAFLRTDESGVDVSSFTDFAPAVPRVIKQRYPRTGGANPAVKLGIVAATGGPTEWMNPSDAQYEYIVAVDWLPDSRSVAVQTTNRPQTQLDVWRFDRGTSRTTRVLSDEDPALVYQKEIQFADGGKAWIVSFENDGHTHLFRYGADGTRQNAVTHGPWSVRGSGSFYGAAQGAAFVDEKNGLVYFTAIEKSPLERHLYRIRFDGSGMTRITREDGTHRVTLSPDRRFFVDNYSNRDTPPSLAVYDVSGKRHAVLAESRGDVFAPFGLSRREAVTIPASDGFDLPASLLKLPGFNPARKYPVLIHVYGGPGAPIVLNRWDRDALFDQLLASRGYVVASFDPRSATGRSKKLEDLVVRKMMSDVELGDLKDAVKWLKAQPWADAERFGIWGWSGGGSYTLLAMTRTSEFKAGISGAPVTDWHFYDSKFGEAYMKTADENPDGYASTSFLNRAKDLSGRLLLMFGTYDDNVHPQNEWAFADALVAAGKQFELMVYPMRKHTFLDKAAIKHRAETMLEFWKRNL
jgi:dipeptidyl-peptidase 4